MFARAFIFLPNRRRISLGALAFGLAVVLVACSSPPTELHTVRIVAVLRPSAERIPVYLTGNSPILGNWNPSAVPMSRMSDSVWSVTLVFPRGSRIEFKITGNTWWTEALNSSGVRYSNLQVTVVRDTTVEIPVYGWLYKMENAVPVFTERRFEPRQGEVLLDELWRYHAGDTLRWSDPTVDDSQWTIANPSLEWTEPGNPKWTGVGWFRFHLYVDSSLWHQTVAVSMTQLGASEIFYNGRLLYSFGTVGPSAETTTPNAMTWWQPFTFAPQYDQLIAVRYANFDAQRIQQHGYKSGFLIRLKNLNLALRDAVAVREYATTQGIFTLIPLTFGFLHLTLFGFYRKQRQNLYYAVCMLAFAGVTHFDYVRNLVVDVPLMSLYTRLNAVCVTLAIFFGLLTNYASIYERMPRRVWAYGVLFCALFIIDAAAIFPRNAQDLNYVFFGIITVDILSGAFRTSNKVIYGGWFLFAGFACLSIFVATQILLDYGFLKDFLGLNRVWVYGMLGLAVSMSVFLSINVSRTNQDLERQLETVRELSSRAIEQERRAHEQELERTMMEAENKRKNDELESARELQLSLLPKEVPNVRGLEIAAFMKTASEVGGDYYDFIPSGDGSLLVAIGDATGHGLRAGNLVTATKGLLNVLSSNGEVEQILVKANHAVKGMNLHMLTMCLSVARVRGDEVQLSSAGMPPALVYRASRRKCDQIVQKAMPLGAVEAFPYKTSAFRLDMDDVLVLTSDGLSEYFNEAMETYGLQEVGVSVERHAERTANEIVQAIYADAMRWGNNRLPGDDVTIVVLKARRESNA